MPRPSDITRERILKAAERLFADRSYEETSIRAIVAKARVNQAAINYHFGGKDGLYREILRTAFRALTEQQLAPCTRDERYVPRERAWRIYQASAASARGTRHAQPALAHFQLGSRASYGRVSQTHERGGGAVHGACS